MNQLQKVKRISRNTLIIDTVAWFFIAAGIVQIFSGTSIYDLFDVSTIGTVNKINRIFASLLFVIATLIGNATFIFKVILCVELSTLKSKKLENAKLFAVLSIFFGLLFTFLTFNNIDKYEEAVQEQKEEEEDIQVNQETNKSITKIKKMSRTILILDFISFGFLVFSSFGVAMLIIASSLNNSIGMVISFILITLLYLTFIAISITSFVFKLIISIRLSKFKYEKFQTAKLYFILSIFFSFILTIFGFKRVKELKVNVIEENKENQ
ncbi:hypothetical protein [Mycoplasma sp. 1012]